MAINSTDLADDLKAEFAKSSDFDTGVLPQVEDYYDKLAIIITDHIKRGSVTSVHVDGGGDQDNTASIV